MISTIVGPTGLIRENMLELRVKHLRVA